MYINKINSISFLGRNNKCKALELELKMKEARIKQLEKENKTLKRIQAEDSWQKMREREIAERTMCEDLGCLWD